MTKVELRWVHRTRDRHGHLRHYFRRPGYARATLPGLPGSPEFMAAYEAAVGGFTAPKLEIGASRTIRGSLSALIVAYYGSAEFKQLARVTQATYRNVAERLRKEHGDKPVAQLQREHVRRLVSARSATPAGANALLKLLRLLMRFAMNEGWRADDPTQGVRKLRTTSEGFTTWSEDHIRQFESHHQVGTRQRLALTLLLYTGQRRSDVVHLGRQHIATGHLLLRQQKTGKRLSIPVHPLLQAELDLLPKEQLTFLLTNPGKPFTSAGFGNWFADAVRAAGLPAGLSAHGLRKACARRLAESGCTAHEIASITGHKSLREVEHYTRAADQSRLAVNAMDRVRTSNGNKT